MRLQRFAFFSIALILGGIAYGSDAGKNWGIERQEYDDAVTGIRIQELTGAGHPADNLYFHVSNFSADNRFLLFASSRSGSAQLFRADIQSGQLTQLTDQPDSNPHTACPHPINPRKVFHVRGGAVFELDIIDLTERKVGEIPQPHRGGFGQPTLSPDGHWLTLAKRRDEANWEIGMMEVATGSWRTIVSVGFPIGHVQHSPTDAVIFFVWETGGYAPQRSWLVNEDGSAMRPFYARTDPKTWFTPLKEWVTHEAWIKDTGEMTMINDKQGVMIVAKDGTAHMARRGEYWHAAARPDGKFLVVDDMKGQLWLMESSSGKSRLLATGLRDKVKTVHPHPSFDRLGRYVQFHSGHTHETVALIDLTTLPPFDWGR